MEGAGGEASATPDSGEGNEGGQENLTTTQSGIPIAPVFGGAMATYNFKPVLRKRKEEFQSQQKYRQHDYGTEFRNPYIPRMQGPKGGVDANRHLSGTGQIYDEPLEFFKAQTNNLDKTPSGVRRPSRPADPNQQRKRGAAAYRKNNKANVDRGTEM